MKIIIVLIVVLCVYLEVNSVKHERIRRLCNMQKLKSNTNNMVLVLWGGLGNKMFQYASTLCLARRKKFKFSTLRLDAEKTKNPNHRSLIDTFPFLSSNIVDIEPSFFLETLSIFNYDLPTFNIIKHHGWAAYYQTIPDMLIKDNSTNSNYVIIYEYLQSWRYFQECRKTLKREFAFHAKDRLFARTLLGRYTADIKNVLFIGVHIRIGDKASKKEVDNGYVLPSRNFYKKAIKYFEDKYQNKYTLRFVVISDDIQKARSEMTELLDKDKLIFSNGQSAAGDLAALASCNHTITSNGSYGWWGAFLAGGETVYFTDFVRPGSHISIGYKKSDFFPDSWIGFDDTAL